MMWVSLMTRMCLKMKKFTGLEGLNDSLHFSKIKFYRIKKLKHLMSFKM